MLDNKKIKLMKKGIMNLLFKGKGIVLNADGRVKVERLEIRQKI